MKWGFVGAGTIALEAMGPAIHDQARAALHAVGSGSPERARALAPAHVYPTYQAVLDDPEVEVVYVALPNDLHAPWTLAALQAGKHVLCEKPLGLSEEEVTRMQACAVRAQRRLVEATWTRWHPRVRRAEALLARGAIGRVTSLHATFSFRGVPDWSYRHDPSRGGGALYDLGPYVVGAALWGLGVEALEVIEVQRARGALGADLDTQVILRGGGAEVQLRACIDGPDVQALRVAGTEGELVFEDPALTPLGVQSRLRVREAGGWRCETFDPVNAYGVMVEHVCRAVRGDEGAWLLPPVESRRVARQLDRIRAR